MKAAAYVRVSTEMQTTDNQLPSIEGLCKIRGWELVKVYSENASAWSGGRQTELARCIRTQSITILKQSWFGFGPW